LGIIFEIAFQKDLNKIEQIKFIEKNNEQEDKLRRLDAELESDSKNGTKNKEVYSKCPNCGSKSIKMYRFPPLFLKEYICEDCDYDGTSITKIHKKRESKIIRSICSNCGSCKIKPHIGGITGTYGCMDCKFVGIPIIEEWDSPFLKE
jgi:predicted RNA-binding Zn-ribbon protein involved in translation (DUF1610 family)